MRSTARLPILIFSEYCQSTASRKFLLERAASLSSLGYGIFSIDGIKADFDTMMEKHVRVFSELQKILNLSDKDLELFSFERIKECIQAKGDPERIMYSAYLKSLFEYKEEHLRSMDTLTLKRLYVFKAGVDIPGDVDRTIIRLSRLPAMKQLANLLRKIEEIRWEFCPLGNEFMETNLCEQDPLIIEDMHDRLFNLFKSSEAGIVCIVHPNSLASMTSFLKKNQIPFVDVYTYNSKVEPEIERTLRKSCPSLPRLCFDLNVEGNAEKAFSTIAENIDSNRRDLRTLALDTNPMHELSSIELLLRMVTKCKFRSFTLDSQPYAIVDTISSPITNLAPLSYLNIPYNTTILRMQNTDYQYFAIANPEQYKPILSLTVGLVLSCIYARTHNTATRNSEFKSL